MGRKLGTLWLLLLVIESYRLVEAQIPRVCATTESLTSRTCCPIPTGASAACGNDLGRGECRLVSPYCYTQYPNNGDPRLNWPSYFFNRTCRCNGNYAGYDCGECKFGYEGNDCNTKSSPLRMRQNIMDMTDSEWEDYNNKIITAKNAEESRYVILLFNEADGNAFNAKPVNISLYNMFVWMHHYVAKNNRDTYTKQESGMLYIIIYTNNYFSLYQFLANDYAHESTGFLTWHRLFLLWFEREMQILLNDPSFTIRYWNWTNNNDRTSIFSFNKLGSNGNDGTVSSNYYGGNNWQSVCWFRNSTKNSQTCNPTDSDGIRPIIRCPSPTQCAGTYSKWSSQETINSALNLGSYSNGPYYNKYSENAFSNFLEGFEPNPSGDLENLEFNYGDGIAIARHLHNLVSECFVCNTVVSFCYTHTHRYTSFLE